MRDAPPMYPPPADASNLTHRQRLAALGALALFLSGVGFGVLLTALVLAP